MMNNKVLIVATVPSMIGQFNMSNIRILQHLGYSIDVACNFDNYSVWKKDRITSFIKLLDSMGIRTINISFSRSPYNIKSHLESFADLLNLLKNEQYSFIHTHTPIASFLVRLAASITHTKVIYTAHGFHFYKGSSIFNWIVYYPLEWLASWFTDTMLTINEEDYTLAINHLHAKETFMVPGVGVDISRFSKSITNKESYLESFGVPNSSFVLTSVGELNKNKNHSIVIRALANINDSSIHYLIAGDGELKEELLLLVDKLGLNNQVHLLGFREDIPELYSVSDVCVFPSIREGQGIAAIEGMASGLPLIISDNRGLRGIVSSNNAIICKPNQVTDFEKAIITLKNDHYLRKKMACNNKELCKRFGMVYVDSVMKDLYSKFLLED